MSRGIAESQSRAGRSIGFEAMVHLKDLDVPLGSQHSRGALDEVGQQGHAECRVRRPQDRDFLRCGSQTPARKIVEARCADEDWNSRRSGTVEAGLQC